ncbi:transposase [Paracoccus sp. PAR01]|uniref:transposase n=1 Tax=Paracoccus sp. PAR01 TaxID=2769282 RepID=UPI001786B625|nr:transposase [Paracoccus sp. PAR01]MBD9528888.1 transposase [Paracoccus sp. PAR01]
MTKTSMDLSELLAKHDQGELLRSIAEAVLQLIMEADVDGLLGAGRHERSGERTTRLGTLNLKVPKLRQGSYFPGFLEARKTSEPALVAVIQETWLGGVSTRRVDDLIQAMGREIIGLGIGPSEAEIFWTVFLRSLRSRGLDGARLVISDAHAGLRAGIAHVLEATWQRRRVHWMRNALTHVSKGQHTVVAAVIRQVCDQPDRVHASEIWGKVAKQVRPRRPKLADLMDESEDDILAYMTFPRRHRTPNPIERLNKGVKRRADVVGIFPNEASILHLIGAVLFEQNDEWQTASRYIMVEAFTQIEKEEIDPILSITTKGA